MSDPGSGLRFPDAPKLELDALIDQLIDRARDVKRAQGRLRALLRAIETVTGELSLEAVLRNIVEAACQLTGARYGALGVVSRDGLLEQFIYVGVDEQTARRIGHLPQGKGLLGALITDPRPIRLREMSGDERSVGFPANHPPMQSFLGVPVHVRQEVFGNLYLTDSEHGEFSAEDEELVTALALAAGTAISNARLYHEAQVQQRWLAASVEVGAQLLSAAGEDPLRTVARRAMEIAGADLVALSLLAPDGETLVVEEAFGPGTADLVGRRFALDETRAGEVLRDGTPLLAENAMAADGPPTVFGSVPPGPLMIMPLRGTGRARGVLTLVRAPDRPRFAARDLEMAAGFASQASVALELADSRAAEQRLVLLEDRDRIAMDLHDHVIQELFAIGLSLRAAAVRLGDDHPVGEHVKQRVEDLDRTIRRIRTSIFDLRGSLVTSRNGLRQRVLEVASDITPALAFAPHVAFSGLLDVQVEADLMDDVVACVRELLTNVARHARASSAAVDVSLAGDLLTITVTDNGIGPDGAARESGTRNLRARAEKRGGSFELVPGMSGGSTAKWKVSIGGK